MDAADYKNINKQTYYGVTTTGIFCRVGCPSRPPLKQNTVFFETPQQALDAGYRPCKRCRPDLPDYAPAAALAIQIKDALDVCSGDCPDVNSALNNTGLSPRRAAQIFRAQYGITPAQYAGNLRAEEAKRRLADGIPVLDVALEMGFESVSAFYAFFHRHAQMPPGACRHIPTGSAATDPYQCSYDTAIGRMRITSDGEALTSALYERADAPSFPDTPDALTDEAARQLREYFAGKRREFTVPQRPRGTGFQQAVWQALRAVPYGQTRSYGQIAAAVGNPGASRAVGMANNKNPLMIFVPCHRVVGANGSLVGYAAGLDVKRKLLELEKQHVAQS